MALYFDTSALVKLIIPEEGTEALETFINRADWAYGPVNSHAQN